MIQIDMDMPDNCLECRFYNRRKVTGEKAFLKQYKDLFGVDYSPICTVTDYCLGNSDDDVRTRRGYGCPLHETQDVVTEAKKKIEILNKALRECQEG